MRTKLYVGNLNFNTTASALETAFSAGGRSVVAINLPSDESSGRIRGFAFVEMGSESDATAAIAALNGTEIDGRSVKVDHAQPRATAGPRSSGGGSYGGHRHGR